MIDLSRNENPRGPNPKANAKLQALSGSLRLYPSSQELIDLLAFHHKVKPDNILIGNGSSNILELIARALLKPGDEAIMNEYSFVVYELVSAKSGANIIKARLNNFQSDLSAIEAAITERTRVIWIDNPSNPIGSFTEHSEIKELIERIPKGIVLVIDEAYWDYLPDDLRTDTTLWTKNYQNIIIVRTFSKLHGLAALRIGYCVADHKLINKLRAESQLFSVNSTAIAAASVAISDQIHINTERKLNQSAISQLVASLGKLSLECIPPNANFITVKFEDSDQIHRLLLAGGVKVQSLHSYGLRDYLRITAGTPEQNQQVINIIRKAVSNVPRK